MYRQKIESHSPVRIEVVLQYITFHNAVNRVTTHSRALVRAIARCGYIEAQKSKLNFSFGCKSAENSRQKFSRREHNEIS